MNYSQAKVYLRNKGITLRSKDGEFYVSFKNDAYATSYEAWDLNDAINHGRFLWEIGEIMGRLTQQA